MNASYPSRECAHVMTKEFGPTISLKRYMADELDP